jgi:hypothetical protein
VESDYAGKTLLWRLGSDGKWRADNGEPGLAFVGSIKGEAFVWSAKCSCPHLNACAAGAGSNFAFDKLDIAVIRFERVKAIKAPKKKAKAKR